MTNEEEPRPEIKPHNDDEVVFEVHRSSKKGVNPNCLLSIGAGLLASAAATILWILLSHTSKLTGIGLIVAFGVASAIKFSGKPSSVGYGIFGAGMSLLVSLAGNLSTAVFLYGQRYHRSALAILSQSHFTYAFNLLCAISDPLDYLMYIGIIVIGYRFSFRKVPTILP